jgi:hypothetical protein
MNNYMTRSDDASRPASTLNVLAGIWLIISSWALGFAGSPVPFWNTLLVGVAVLVLAAIRLGTVGTIGLSWANFILGIWLIISPFVLRFGSITAATSNAVITGILIGIFSLWAALGSRSPALSPQ